MFQSFIHRLLKRRHFWRYASFDEVAELYASRMMRLLAQYMINMFVALYLYQQGYSLLFIAVYYAICFALRIVFAYISFRFVARFGPKHGILVANLIYIPALVAFTLVPHFGVYAIAAFGLFRNRCPWYSTTCRIWLIFPKSNTSSMQAKKSDTCRFERLTASLSPLIGGTIAFLIAPEATMWLSAILFAVASWPLFRTKEQVRTHQKLEFRRFPWRDTWRSIPGRDGYRPRYDREQFHLGAVHIDRGIQKHGNDLYFTVGAFA